MADFLDEMAQCSRDRADEALRVGDSILAKMRSAKPARALQVQPGRFELIAEVKLTAPSVGVLAQPEDPHQAVIEQARAYLQGGAAIVSVLTEPTRFGGELSHLGAIAGAGLGPLMRKDFLRDPIQLVEARAAGASGALLIARMLGDAMIDAMLYTAHHAGLFVLIEAFDEDDLHRIAGAQARRRGLGPPLMVGVNCRDLATLQIDPDRFLRLAEHLPPGLPAVAESGLTTPQDIARIADAGYQLALVGSSLMQAPDPKARVAELVAAGRSAYRVRR